MKKSYKSTSMYVLVTWPHCPQIAREALEKEHREAEAKESTSDLVTETDKKVEELIISSLQQRFPKHK